MFRKENFEYVTYLAAQAGVRYSLKNKVDFQPKTTFNDGVENFVEWFKAYHHQKNGSIQKTLITH